MIDFMPGFAKEEQCFKDAVLYDFRTKKVSDEGWPFAKSAMQLSYENGLKKSSTSRQVISISRKIRMVSLSKGPVRAT